MLQFDISQLPLRHFLPKLFTVLKCVLLNCLTEIRVRTQQRERYTILVKILTVMIRVHDGRAECCLNWNIYDIGVNCEF